MVTTLWGVTSMHALAKIDCPFHVIRRRDKLEAQERRRFKKAVQRLLGGTDSTLGRTADRTAHKRKKQ